MEKKYLYRRIGALAIIILLVILGIKYFSGKSKATVAQSKSSVATKTAKSSTKAASTKKEKTENITQKEVTEEGKYSSKEEVAAYIRKFNKLPSNYIKKAEATKLGWKPSEGNLWSVTDKKSIGGDIFSDAEGVLPKKKGRKYYECDINYNGGTRGPERIIFSNDGLIFYTDNHYQSFTELK